MVETNGGSYGQLPIVLSLYLQSLLGLKTTGYRLFIINEP
jgi:hypothetical protein